jgi:hypothetical protein
VCVALALGMLSSAPGRADAEVWWLTVFGRYLLHGWESWTGVLTQWMDRG